MTGVIKSGDLAAASVKVRSLPARRLAPETHGVGGQIIDSEVLSLRRELAHLSRQLEESEEVIKRHPAALEAAFAEGEAAGRSAGAKEADERYADRIRVLSAGIDRALELFSGELSSMERLAALLAREGIGKILGNTDRHDELLTQIIRSCVVSLEGQSIIRIEVSERDFDDPSRLAALGTEMGRPGLDIQTSAELEAGDCRVSLSLGGLDIGINQQWGRLSGILEDLAGPSSPE